jgi:uncharacterized protein (TIGR03067 family)
MKTLSSFVVVFACGLAFAGDNKKSKWSDLDHMQGTWAVSSTQGFSKDTSPDELKNLKLVVKGNELTVSFGDQKVRGTFTLKETTTPQQMDVKVTEGPNDVKGKTFPCIYLLEGNVLKVAFRDPGEKRPSEFITRDRKDMHEVWFKKAPK